MRLHQLKSWGEFFDAIKRGDKLHDLRRNDRDYRVGDYIFLERYDQFKGEYTGEYWFVRVSYITSNRVPCAFSSSALHRNYSLLSLQPVNGSRDSLEELHRMAANKLFVRPLDLSTDGL